jgi:hypothetical protein
MAESVVLASGSAPQFDLDEARVDLAAALVGHIVLAYRKVSTITFPWLCLTTTE